MKIGIDARLYNQTGVGVYIRNLIYYLQQLAPKDIIFYIFLLEKDYHQLSFKKNFIKVKADFKWHTLAEQCQYLQLINKYNLDLMHFTYFSYPILYRKPYIITIHDLTPLEFKTGRASTHSHIAYNMKHAAYKFLIKQAASNSKAIITPTNTIKTLISQKFPNIPKSKIHVTYEGVNYEMLKVQPNEKLKTKFNQPFFIYVGNFYPHKNIDNLIKAFAAINKYQLILVGPNDYFSDKVKDFITSLKLQSKIVFYHHPTLADLAFFYKNAQALIYPSLSEGFGLPIVEAAYFKCPIIASDIKVFEEIIGNQYHKFNPNDISSIEKVVNDFINNPEIRNSPIALNPNFDFKTMTQSTLNIYRK